MSQLIVSSETLSSRGNNVLDTNGFKQGDTLLLDFLACASFAGNYALSSILEPSISDVVHILLVQFPLAVALFRYQSDPPCGQSFNNLRY